MPKVKDKFMLDVGLSILTSTADVLKLHQDVCHSVHLEWGRVAGGAPYLYPKGKSTRQ